MTRNVFLFSVCLSFTLFAGAVQAADKADQGAKELSGMSILGNSEAPKSLVIVPWKSSEIGDGIGVSNMLDERARPVDRDVFMRELSYYEIRADMPHSDAQSAAEQ